MSDELIAALQKHDSILSSTSLQLRDLRTERNEVDSQLTDYKNQWFFYIEYNKQLKEIESNYKTAGNTERAMEVALQLNEGMDKEAIYMANTIKCEKD